MDTWKLQATKTQSVMRQLSSSLSFSLFVSPTHARTHTISLSLTADFPFLRGTKTRSDFPIESLPKLSRFAMWKFLLKNIKTLQATARNKAGEILHAANEESEMHNQHKFSHNEVRKTLPWLKQMNLFRPNNALLKDAN